MLGRRGTALVGVLWATLSAQSLARAALCNPDPINAGNMKCSVTTIASLNQVFVLADADPNNTYNVSLAKGTYTFTQNLVLTQGSVVIVGAPTGGLSNVKNYVLNGTNTSTNTSVRQFTLQPANSSQYPFLFVGGVTIQNGEQPGGTISSAGGCVGAGGGEVEIEQSIVQGCHAPGLGGAIASAGSAALLLTNSLVQNNYIDSVKPSTGHTPCGGGNFTNGGGIDVYSGGAASIESSAIVNNQACRGGGLEVFGGSLYMDNTTVAGNTANSHGGAMRVIFPTTSLDLLFNTIVENSAALADCRLFVGGCASDAALAGGIAFESATGASVSLQGNIIAYNKVVFSSDGTTNVVGTANSLDDCDLIGTTLDTSNNSPTFNYSTNVIGQSRTCNLPTSWWGVNATPTLANLSTFGLNNQAAATLAVGGTLPAYKPTSTTFFHSQFGRHNSIGAGGNVTAQSCLGGDERGYRRSSVNCDVGSYELNGVKP